MRGRPGPAPRTTAPVLTSGSPPAPPRSPQAALTRLRRRRRGSATLLARPRGPALPGGSERRASGDLRKPDSSPAARPTE